MIGTPNAVASDFEVLPLNVPILEAFMALQTQWRIAPSGIRLGIDYQAAQAVLAIQGVEDEERRIVFDGIRLMEGQVLETLDNGRQHPQPERHPKGRR